MRKDWSLWVEFELEFEFDIFNVIFGAGLLRNRQIEVRDGSVDEREHCSVSGGTMSHASV